MNLRRLRGVLLIVNTLIPIILVLTIAVTLWTIVNDIKHLVSEPLAMMNLTLSEIQLKVNDAGRTLDPVFTSADNIQQEVTRLSQQIGTIPESVRFLNNSVAIPGLVQVKQVLEGNLQLLRDFGTVASGLSALQGLRDGIQLLAEAGDNLVVGIQRIVTKLVGLILVVSAIAIPWIAISYGSWVYQRLQRGWLLLQGTPPTDSE